MPTYNGRNPNRRKSSRVLLKNPFMIFSTVSVIFGLLFFSVAGIIRWVGVSFVECETTEDYVEVITSTVNTDRITTTVTDSNTEDTDPTQMGEPNVHDKEYVKQTPAAKVTYASILLDTRSLLDKVDSESVILIDISNNSVVASKSPDTKIYPASLTKVMTLITAYDFIEDPYKETFTMTHDILNPLINSGNSLAGFEVGETNSLIDYMYGMVMFSGADAAEGIATYCCGSVDAFVDAMNRKAKEIGLKSSHFTNPVGTHDADHYSTAHDMALVLGYAYEVDILTEILNTYRYTSSPTDVHPAGLYWEANLQQRMKGDESGTCEVLGGKTGYTKDAGHCVVAYARSNKTGKYYLFAATGGEGMYDPIWDCINTLKEYVE